MGFQRVLGQSHVISMVSLERGWANSKPPVASPWSTPGPIPRYWPCLPQGKLGQSHAIGIVSLEEDGANSRPTAWSPARHADASAGTGALRHARYTAYTLMSVPDLLGWSLANTISSR